MAGTKMEKMEGMRELLRRTLGRSLGAMPDEDRLAAAWPVVCGKALAERGTILGYAEGAVRIEVTDQTWLRQMMSMRGQLTGELARIARVKVSEIHFEVKRGEGQRDTASHAGAGVASHAAATGTSSTLGSPPGDRAGGAAGRDSSTPLGTNRKDAAGKGSRWGKARR